MQKKTKQKKRNVSWRGRKHFIRIRREKGNKSNRCYRSRVCKKKGQHLISAWRGKINTTEAGATQTQPICLLDIEEVIKPNLHVIHMWFFKVDWVLRSRFTHKVALIGIYTDCVLHFRARWLWGHSRGGRQRNMAASIRSSTKEEKVQEQRGNEGSVLGGCQGHLRELSREADLWRTLAKPIPQCVCVCVSMEESTNAWSNTCTLEVWPKRTLSVSVKLKDQSWSPSTQKIKRFHFKHEMKQRIQKAERGKQQGTNCSTRKTARLPKEKRSF